MSVIRVASKATQFFPDVLPWPDEVQMFELTGDYLVDANQYGVETDQGWVYINPGEWVVEVYDYTERSEERGDL